MCVWDGGSSSLARRYWSAFSTWFEIMSSYLLAFIFKTFSMHWVTQFWNFLPEVWKNCNQRELVSIGFEKIKKIFFHFFSNKPYFFVWNEILCEMCGFFFFFFFFLRYYYIEIIQNSKFLKFHSSLAIFQSTTNFTSFSGVTEKSYFEKGQMNWNWCPLTVEHDFFPT